MGLSYLGGGEGRWGSGAAGKKHEPRRHGQQFAAVEFPGQLAKNAREPGPPSSSFGPIQWSLSLRTAFKSIPTCSAFLYRWERSRPRARAVFEIWVWLRLSSARIVCFSKARTRL